MRFHVCTVLSEFVYSLLSPCCYDVTRIHTHSPLSLSVLTGHMSIYPSTYPSIPPRYAERDEHRQLRKFVLSLFSSPSLTFFFSSCLHPLPHRWDVRYNPVFLLSHTNIPRENAPV